MPRPSLSHIKTHVFRGRCFKLFWKRPPARNGKRFCGEVLVDGKTRRMTIHPDADAFELLGTVIHESFHAACYDVEDCVVDHFEADTMRLLKRMGIKVSFDPPRRTR